MSTNTATGHLTQQPRSVMTDPATEADLTAFYTRMSDRLYDFVTVTGGHLFSGADATPLHPALLRDIEPYDGAQVTDAMLSLLENILTGNRWQVARGKALIRKLRNAVDGTASAFNSANYIPKTLEAFNHQTAQFDRLQEIFVQAERAYLSSEIDAKLDAHYTIGMLYIPTDIAESAASTYRYGHLTNPNLKNFERHLNRFYSILFKIAAKA